MSEISTTRTANTHGALTPEQEVPLIIKATTTAQPGQPRPPSLATAKEGAGGLPAVPSEAAAPLPRAGRRCRRRWAQHLPLHQLWALPR